MARYLGTRCLIPENAEVANAVGALTGKIVVSEEVQIRQKKEDDGPEGYWIYLRDGRLSADEKEEAIQLARQGCEEYVRKETSRRGAVGEIKIKCRVWDHNAMTRNGASIELGTIVKCTAVGSFA